MESDSIFRLLFFILLAGMLIVRIYFNIRLKRDG